MSTCKGCLLKHKDYTYRCTLDKNEYFKNILDKCPCQVCLIKGVCRTCCLSFIQYIRTIPIELQKTKDHSNIHYGLDKEGITSRTNALLHLQYRHFEHEYCKQHISEFTKITSSIQVNTDE